MKVGKHIVSGRSMVDPKDGLDELIARVCGRVVNGSRYSKSVWFQDRKHIYAVRGAYVFSSPVMGVSWGASAMDCLISDGYSRASG